MLLSRCNPQLICQLLNYSLAKCVTAMMVKSVLQYTFYKGIIMECELTNQRLEELRENYCGNSDIQVLFWEVNRLREMEAPEALSELSRLRAKVVGLLMERTSLLYKIKQLEKDDE